MNNAISELKEKLSLSNCPKKKCDFFGYFKGIAELLMNKCVISKGNTNYEIIEIELGQRRSSVAGLTKIFD